MRAPLSADNVHCLDQLASNITMRYDNVNSSVRSEENITSVYASYYDTSIGVAFSVLAVLGENILVPTKLIFASRLPWSVSLSLRAMMVISVLTSNFKREY